ADCVCSCTRPRSSASLMTNSAILFHDTSSVRAGKSPKNPAHAVLSSRAKESDAVVGYFAHALTASLALWFHLRADRAPSLAMRPLGPTIQGRLRAFQLPLSRVCQVLPSS